MKGMKIPDARIMWSRISSNFVEFFRCFVDCWKIPVIA